MERKAEVRQYMRRKPEVRQYIGRKTEVRPDILNYSIHTMYFSLLFR